ncbi:MAG: ABC transporter permease [Thermofilaceae archaeon]
MNSNKLDIILVLTEKELKAKYKRSFLGYVWSLINPLLMSLVIYVAFSEIMKFRIENYVFYLLTGLFVWQWIVVTVNNSLYSYLHNATIIKKTNFDRKLLNIAVLNSESLHFLASLPVLFLVFIISYNINVTDMNKFVNILLFPLVFFTTYMFLLGISFIVSAINVIFRDIERITGILLQILFYTSPIVYPKDLPPEKYRIILELNPITHIVGLWRALFIDNLNAKEVVVVLIIAIATISLGLFVHEKLKYKLVEYL